MQLQPTKKTAQSSIEWQSLVKNSTVFYLIIGTVGALISYFHHETLLTGFALPETWREGLYLGGFGVLGAGVLIVLAHLFEDLFPSFRALRLLLMRFMGQLPLAALLYLAVVSSISEEILFRAAIQPSIGLILTSLLFGLLHLGPSNGISAWSLWAFLAGLLLGWMYQSTQSLWPPLIAHVSVNSYSMLRFRRDYLRIVRKKSTTEDKNVAQEMDEKL